jgi:hypothetical protein
MDLGCGEYLNISVCFQGPYKHKKVIALLEALKKNKVKIYEAYLVDLDPEQVNYEILMEGNYCEKTIKEMDWEILNSCFISYIYVEFPFAKCRIGVDFLDRESYYIDLLFNYQDLVEEGELVFSLIENEALAIFELLDPLYGELGIESSIEGVETLRQNEGFIKMDKVYFSNEILNLNSDLFRILQSVNHQSILADGIYFRDSDVDQFDKSAENILSITKLLLPL